MLFMSIPFRGFPKRMKPLVLVMLMFLVASPVCAQNLAGDWQGTLHAGAAELRLVLHIAKSDDGTYKGTMDSVDQAANGIPLTAILLKGSDLSFTVDSVNGSYEGKLSLDGNSLTGTWSQGKPFPLDFQRSPVPVKTEHKPAKPSDIDGSWLGTLDTGAIKLRVVFHIVNTEDGLMATMDSLDQDMKGLPVTSVTRQGTALKLEAKQINGVFEGTISPDLATISGTWSQGGGTLPLVLKKVKDTAELDQRRPQNPVKPYPYREEEVVYENSAQNVKLAATLTIPQGTGPFPAVLLITGSGPQDRDESIMGHKPFLVVADYLTRKGIVVLRADDRGVGKSSGTFSTATAADFATDAEAGIAFLKSRREVMRQKIGLIGHSEGAIIAPIVATGNPDAAFIVMMAGSGVPGEDILVAQSQLIAEASGESPALAEKTANSERAILDLVKSEKDTAALKVELREKLAGEVPEARLEAEISQVTSPWFRYFISYDPATALRKVRCPVLVINGEKDLQVPPKQNLPAIRKALEEAGNKHFEIDELPGLNHLFQTAKTGAPSEYGQIEETISPIALEKIASWVLQQTESR